MRPSIEKQKMRASSATLCGTGKQGHHIPPLQMAVRCLWLQSRARQSLSCRKAVFCPPPLIFPYLIKFDEGCAGSRF